MSLLKSWQLRVRLTRLFEHAMKNWAWVLLIVGALFIRILATQKDWVEKYYTHGTYPVISLIQRYLFGWLPLSVGDWIYGALSVIILLKTAWFFRDLVLKKINRSYLVSGLQQLIFFFLFVYVFFNLGWGLNYNRQGIAKKLSLQTDSFSVNQLDTLAHVLQQRANYYRSQEQQGIRKQLKRKKNLFQQAQLSFDAAAIRFPFLKMQTPSIKPSLYSYMGNYLGFQGYYNPFTGEGQVNTTIPIFVQPFVTTHEMAHQIGFAKESEANFVGYLVCKKSPNLFFRYSAYLDMYLYANGLLYQLDSSRAIQIASGISPLVAKDIRALKQFYQRYKSPLEDWIMVGYDYFLQANQQPQGKRSYGQVTGWLLAWVRKEGWNAL
ncbi:MAG: hypothetical protein RLZZ466_1480 [Bacteroidota bacterium]